MSLVKLAELVFVEAADVIFGRGDRAIRDGFGGPNTKSLEPCSESWGGFANGGSGRLRRDVGLRGTRSRDGARRIRG
jgi:hypothetical protein